MRFLKLNQSVLGSVFFLVLLFTHINFILECKARKGWQGADTDLSLLIKNINIYAVAFH